MPHELKVLNLDAATYECTFGRGCDGVCCRQGRPSIEADEIERIESNLDRFLPHMRPAAAALVQREGIVSRRRRYGLPMMRVIDGWCIFFERGCVLHRVGEAEWDRFKYKPSACALFPLAGTKDGEWYVRQHGYRHELWDLFCLDPANSHVPAAQSLKDEIALAAHFAAQNSQETAAAPAIKPVRSRS